MHLFEKEGFAIAIPKGTTMANVLIGAGFNYIKEMLEHCHDNNISVCYNETELGYALGEFYGNY
ncbi:hypothetical protein AVV36_gp027 [Pectobacterium bacteriophage PM2]|uniref:Uncharacterized protein n=1 Tax=Pectobacterium bacteriophage PM2 TaxID=1429794 RepID=A0A0A0PZE1_9CAUD|nr:hypothetical protein AVV36_gp027 [Pectobacterium bacteriophage PM2]AHY24989.1 hypothetical protein PM2_027 [Pectobacterium bacteriophage PM2]